MGFALLATGLEGAAGIAPNAREVYAGGGDAGGFCGGRAIFFGSFFSVFGSPLESCLFDEDVPCFKVLRKLC